MALIKLEKVSKVYNTKGLDVHALREADLEVEEGEFLSIAGPSGSGKTTMLNIIGCLDHPTGGTFRLEGTDVGALGGSEPAEIRRAKIGFIFQTFNLVPVFTAFENVEFPLMLNGVKPRERVQIVQRTLEQVGLKDFMERKPSEMSGGQQQRVAIARALVKKPKLVLADEPTANLDSVTGREVLELMLSLNRDTGATFIFSTHDQMVMDFARRLVRLKDGEVISDEKKTETKQDERG